MSHDAPESKLPWPDPASLPARFAQFPRALASRTRSITLGDVPALVAHPTWESPAPVMIWMHGRTVSKELDPGRYLRWIRAGVCAVALDLPGHGERYDARLQHPRASIEVVSRMVAEIDGVLESLRSPEFSGVADLSRVGIGGMSAGGMATLRRLCDPHPFCCAAVEGTTGRLTDLYFPGDEDPRETGPWGIVHDPGAVRAVDPSAHLDTFRPIPLLALHSEADQVVPFATLHRFLEDLRGRYTSEHADPSLIELRTWPQTGAPLEHAGFGRFGNDAKNAQVEFLSRHLRATPLAGF